MEFWIGTFAENNKELRTGNNVKEDLKDIWIKNWRVMAKERIE